MQSTDNILLIRPANFSYNTETSSSNVFQKKLTLDKTKIMNEVSAEFTAFVVKLNEKGINCFIIDDTENPIKPDAIFPNNWVSFHEDGKVIIYPMLAENRRLEKRLEIIEELKKNFNIKQIIDLSFYENENKFLEGTGSVVFDHLNKTAYASLSPRTDEFVFKKLCDIIDYKPITFHSFDADGKEIYHTNVMMSIFDEFAVVCLESIINKNERELIINSIEKSGKNIIDINFKQMYSFAGNMLQLKNSKGERFIVMSYSAYDLLSQSQKNRLEGYTEVIPLYINTIETIGGGSVRCMIAEIFSEKLIKT